MVDDVTALNSGTSRHLIIDIAGDHLDTGG